MKELPMRLFGLSLAVLLAAFAVTGCTSKSSTNSSDQSSATATAAATDNGAAASGGTSTSNDAAGTEIPKYPGADTNASGSSSNGMNGGSAAGTVMSTSDSFDKVYTWYQGHMPSG
jgi:uncharacterized protein (UPF0333 family)